MPAISTMPNFALGFIRGGKRGLGPLLQVSDPFRSYRE
jgi:hypothetical protein